MWIILVIVIVIIFLIVLPMINKMIDEPKDNALREKMRLVYKLQKLFELRRDPNEHPAYIFMRLDHPQIHEECRRLAEETTIEVLNDSIERDIGRLKEMGLSDQDIKDKLDSIM